MLLSSNWNVEESVDISNLVQEYTGKLSDELAELLQEEKCFILNQSFASNNCCLQISCSHPVALGNIGEATNNVYKYIDSLTLLSEARIVEVFVGKYEEYFGTFSSSVVNQFGDASLCRTEISFNKPCSSVRLSLKNTFEASSVMIFGVFARVRYMNPKNMLNSSRFSSGHLNDVLNDHPVKLSKNAEFFKQALQNYNDTSKDSAQGNSLPLSVLPFLNSMAKARENSNESSSIPSFATVQENKSSTQNETFGNMPSNNAENCLPEKHNAALPTGLDICQVMQSLKLASMSEAKAHPALQNATSLDENLIAQIVGSTLDKKLAALESKLTSLINQKISEQTEAILGKLQQIEEKCGS